MKTADYIQAIKDKHGYTSDYAVAKALRVPLSDMSKYRHGKVIPGPLVAVRIAQILGEQEVAVVADLERERAERSGKTEDAQEWTAVLHKIGKGAASILLGALMVGFPNADAGLRVTPGSDTSYTSYQVDGTALQGLHRDHRSPRTPPIPVRPLPNAPACGPFPGPHSRELSPASHCHHLPFGSVRRTAWAISSAASARSTRYAKSIADRPS